MSRNPSCLIVGAGMTGITAGRNLQAAVWDVVLLDKGRGCGGRMATRRVGASLFDHGAQFFTVRDARFAEAARQWQQAGWVVPWFTQEGHVRYRGTRGMNALARCLAEALDVRCETRVVSVEPADDGWKVTTESGEIHRADVLLLTPPAPQSAELLNGLRHRLPPELLPALSSIVYDPCLALLVTLAGNSAVPPPGYVRPAGGPVEWLADNTAKGISSGPAALTIHARADFSAGHFQDSQSEVARILLDAAEPWMPAPAAEWQLHRWKFSHPVPGERPMYLLSRQPAPLLIAGDAFGGSRLEGAFLSGFAAAAQIAKLFPPDAVLPPWRAG